MQYLSLLDRVVLTYEPIWGPSRQLVGVRLHVRVVDDTIGIPHLLHAIDDWWSSGSVLLMVALAEPRHVRQALVASPPEHLWLELPEGAPHERAEWRSLADRAQRLGHRLVQRMPPGQVPPEPSDRLRAAPPRYLLQGLPRPAAGVQQALGVSFPGQIHVGVEQVAQAAQFLDGGHAWGVVGWPIADALARHSSGAIGVDKGTLLRVQQALLRDMSTEKVLAIVHSDPVLAYRLLQLLNSEAFNRGRVMPSVRQAMGLLGERRVREALMRLLPLAVSDPDLLPARRQQVLLARILLMLVDAGAQQTLANDVLLLGLFAELSRWLRASLAAIVERVPLSAAVREALLENAGPYAAYLALVKRLADPARASDLLPWYQAAGFTAETVNTALLRALAQAHVWT